MTVLTQEEQLFLELTNRARLDPQAEVIRQGLTSVDQFTQPGVTPSTPMSLDPKQPLAGSNILTGVAERHAAFVFNEATKPGSSGIPVDPHNGAGDGSVKDRIHNAGYNQNLVDFHWYRWENFSVRQDSNPIQTDAQKQAAIELMHNGLFFDKPHTDHDDVNSLAGHRLAMLDPLMREMGAGMKVGTFQGFNTAMAFENFGDTGTKPFITGAVYNDTKIVDNFYSLGEAVQGVTVTVKGAINGADSSDTTGSGGGFSVLHDGGPRTVVFTGGSAGTVSATIQASSTLNAKIDLVNGNRIESNVSTTLGNDAAKDLRLLGMENVNATGNGAANTITGNKGANILDGKGGNDSLDGANGDDTVNLSGNKADYQVTLLSATSAKLTDSRGIDGTDTIFNIEHVHFNDQTIDFSALKNTTPPAVAGSVAISDFTIAEGNNGQTFATFDVIRSAGTAAFDVAFATADGSAQVGDGDYAESHGSVHFNASDTKKTISIAINGDTKVENDETFSVTLSGATNGATISRALATGHINTDDAAAPVNHKPVVTTSNVKLAANTSVAASTLFKATDADGNGTIKQYALWDAGSAGGHFTVDGVTQAAGKWIVVNAADLGSVKYVGGPSVGSEKLFVSASDGSAWSTNVSLTAVTAAHSPEDFNGNNTSDVLWQRANGAVAMWQMDGNKVASNKTVGSVAKDWHIEGTEDFGGDGKADILFRNDAGKVALWQMDGNKIVSNQSVGTAAKNWHISAVDDFGGDGKADILWTSDSGQVAEWQMDGKKIVVNTAVGTIAKGWHVQGSSDFNGDGKSDLILESDGGSVAIWQMNGTKIASTKTVGKIGGDWHFAGAEDFNGDGKADVLWHNDNGKVAMWQMNGNTISSNTVFGTADKTWDVADVGDYNKDGHADILWQKSNGSVAMWEMNGTHIDHNVAVAAASTDWLII